MTSVAGSSRSAGNRGAGHPSADLWGQVASADADDLADSHAPAIEQRHGLLGARAGGSDHADGPGPDRVREPQANAPEHRRSGARTHQQPATGQRVILERHFLVDRHVVAEQQDVQVGRESLVGGQRGVVPGHGDHGDVGPGLGEHCVAQRASCARSARLRCGTGRWT